jgi:hypothetical protein
MIYGGSLQEKSGGAKPATGYRRKKVDKEISLEDDGQDNSSFYECVFARVLRLP